MSQNDSVHPSCPHGCGATHVRLDEHICAASPGERGARERAEYVTAALSIGVVGRLQEAASISAANFQHELWQAVTRYRQDAWDAALAASSQGREREAVLAMAEQHAGRWQDRDDAYWLQRLMQEVGELASSLAGDHTDPPEHELAQVGSIAINWLRKFAAPPAQPSEEGVSEAEPAVPWPDFDAPEFCEARLAIRDAQEAARQEFSTASAMALQDAWNRYDGLLYEAGRRAAPCTQPSDDEVRNTARRYVCEGQRYADGDATALLSLDDRMALVRAGAALAAAPRRES